MITKAGQFIQLREPMGKLGYRLMVKFDGEFVEFELTIDEARKLALEFIKITDKIVVEL